MLHITSKMDTRLMMKSLCTKLFLSNSGRIDGDSEMVGVPLMLLCSPWWLAPRRALQTLPGRQDNTSGAYLVLTMSFSWRIFMVLAKLALKMGKVLFCFFGHSCGRAGSDSVVLPGTLLCNAQEMIQILI